MKINNDEQRREVISMSDNSFESLFLQYSENLNIEVAELTDWFVFGNSDYDDCGLK